MGNPPILAGIDFLTIRNRSLDNIFAERPRPLNNSSSSGFGGRVKSKKGIPFPQENFDPKVGGVGVKPPI